MIWSMFLVGKRLFIEIKHHLMKHFNTDFRTMHSIWVIIVWFSRNKEKNTRIYSKQMREGVIFLTSLLMWLINRRFDTPTQCFFYQVNWKFNKMKSLWRFWTSRNELKLSVIGQSPFPQVSNLTRKHDEIRNFNTSSNHPIASDCFK